MIVSSIGHLVASWSSESAGRAHVRTCVQGGGLSVGLKVVGLDTDDGHKNRASHDSKHDDGW